VYVNNVRLYARHLRRDLASDSNGLAEAAHSRLLLQGANGSGKSTFLEAIATLWNFFGDWIDAGPGRNLSGHSRCFKHYFAEADLAAIELGGLLTGEETLWIGMGKVKNWIDLKDEHPSAQFAGLIQTKSARWEVQLPDGDWSTFRQRSLVGSEPQPNIVFFPPEDRTVTFGARRGPPHLVDLMPYSWLSSYSNAVDLESLLLTIRAKSATSYDEALRLINQALNNQHKSIVDFGTEGFIVEGRMSFDPGKTYRHPIADLSSGEKQMLLLIGFIATTLRDRGIVVIDEPDLHIHMSMLQQLMNAIEHVVQQRNSQLIVAGHSSHVWQWFTRSTERIDFGSWKETE
jgi:predicted ATPase